MTTSPHVELLAPGLSLGAAAVDGRVGSVEDQISSGLMSYRFLVINYVKSKLAEETEVTAGRIIALLDEASALFLGRFNTIVGPAAATAYVRAYQAANAGEVPIATIYALADEHTRRIGRYYDATSRDGLLQGFNTFVNRQIPTKVAADRAMDAYGLTPRQMSGYTSLDLKNPVKSASPRSLKRRGLEYIGSSIRRRSKIFASQEAHNLDLQAKQTAWMWMQDKGVLTEHAQKMWLTAKDERTCKICAPMHGKKVNVTERFELPNGIKVWVPGPHPNCRCEIRVIDLHAVSKADFDEELHPRGGDPENPGRFSDAVQERPTHDVFGQPIQPMQGQQPDVQVAAAEDPRKQRGTAVPDTEDMSAYQRAHALRAQQKTAENLKRNLRPRPDLPKLDAAQEAKRQNVVRELEETLRQIKSVEQALENRRAATPAPPTPEAVSEILLPSLGARRQTKLPELKPTAKLEPPKAVETGIEAPKDIQAQTQEILSGAALASPKFSYKGLEALFPQAEALPGLKGAAKPAWKPIGEQEMVAPLDHEWSHVYSVVDNFDHDDEEFHLVQETFFPKIEDAINSATDKRNRWIEDRVKTATKFYDKPATFNYVDRRSPDGNVVYEARIHADEYREILKQVARRSTKDGAKEPYEPITVYLYAPQDPGTWHGGDRSWKARGEHDHYITTTKMTPEEIAGNFGVDQSQFYIGILSLNTVHDPEGGRGTHEHGVYHGRDYWDITGMYKKLSTHPEYATSGDVPVDITEIYPLNPAQKRVQDL